MFADRIKILRKNEGITQAQLAEVIGLSKGTVAMWELGKREATFETLLKLSDHYKVSIDFLLGSSDDASETHYNDEAAERLLGPDPEKMVACAENFFKLDEYGMYAVMQLINQEYKRGVEQDTLTDTYSNYKIRKK